MTSPTPSERLLSVALQIPQVSYQVRWALGAHGVDGAATEETTRREWAEAYPESRAAILLSLTWAARDGAMNNEPDPGSLYAAEFQRHARAHPKDDMDGFHGAGFPALPLPGPAGALASSLAYDRDDFAISLKTALVLMDSVPRPPTEGS